MAFWVVPRQRTGIRHPGGFYIEFDCFEIILIAALTGMNTPNVETGQVLEIVDFAWKSRDDENAIVICRVFGIFDSDDTAKWRRSSPEV